MQKDSQKIIASVKQTVLPPKPEKLIPMPHVKGSKTKEGPHFEYEGETYAHSKEFANGHIVWRSKTTSKQLVSYRFDGCDYIRWYKDTAE
jgi:hypothetical protein